MLLFLLLSLSSSSAQFVETPTFLFDFNQGYDPERVIVRFKPGAKEIVKGDITANGGFVHYDLDFIDSTVANVPLASQAGIARNPNVAYVEVDHPVYPLKSHLENSTEHYHRLRRQLQAETIPVGITQAGVVNIRTITYPNPNSDIVTICMMDSGYHDGHEDLASTSVGTQYLDGSAPSGVAWSEDTCAHGSHCTGTAIAVGGNGKGVIGVADGSDIGSKYAVFVVRVFSGGSNGCSWSYSSSVAGAANECANNGANVISMSLGGSGFSQTSEDTFTALFNQGVISVGAAGNSGRFENHYPASYTDVISVASVTSSGAKSSFSTMGNHVELAAMGSSVLSTVPPNGYAYYSGTSMACPHVAGAFTLLMAHFGTCSSGECADIYRRSFQQTASQADNYDTDLGYGIINVDAAYERVQSLSIVCGTNGDCGGLNDGDNCNGWYTCDQSSSRCVRNTPTTSCGQYETCVSGSTLGDTSCQEMCEGAQIVKTSVTTDNYPNEMGFRMSSGSATLFTKQGFGASYTTYEDVMCLPAGEAVTLDLSDTYGDGWCTRQRGKRYRCGGIETMLVNKNDYSTSPFASLSIQFADGFSFSTYNVGTETMPALSAPCQSGDCDNGGNCDNGVCSCTSGWEGQYCTNDINECDLGNPCGDGSCQNSQGSYACVCPGDQTCTGGGRPNPLYM